MPTVAERTNGNKADFHDSALDAAITETQSSMELRQDLLQMKMENETIMSECRARPRDLAAIRKELEAALDAFPALAKSAVYAKPVGTDPDTGRQKIARGLSVRAAEALAEAYGYCRVRVDVTPIAGDKAKVEATFTDFQKCRIWQDGGVISQYYKSKQGGMVRTPDDRFYGLICKAEASRRVREVILRSVNTALKKWFEEECRNRTMDLLDEKAVDKIIEKFATKGVTMEHLEAFIGRARVMGWTGEDRVELLGIWNAIEEGETTLSEAFGINGKSAEKPKQEQTNGAKTSDLTNPKVGDQESVAKTDPPLTLKEVGERFDACKNLTDIADVVSWSQSQSYFSDTDRKAIKDAAERRREKIRNARGSGYKPAE